MLKLFIAEEQGLVRNVYESAFSVSRDFQLIGVTSDVSVQALSRAASVFQPDVFIIGTRVLRGTVVEAVRQFHAVMPTMTVVLQASSYDLRAAQGLLDHLQRATSGFAFVLKDTVDTVDDLARLAQVAAAGHLVMDPGLMRELMGVLQSYAGFFKALSQRDIEVLDLMAKGLSDEAIAGELGLPVGAVDRQVQAIYEKTGVSAITTHDPRVHTITTYLKAAGSLPVRDFRLRPASELDAVIPDERRSANRVGILAQQEGVVRPYGGPAHSIENPLQQEASVQSGVALSRYESEAGPYATLRNGTHPHGVVLEVSGLVEEALKNAARRYGPDVRLDFERFAASAGPAHAETVAKLLEWAARNNLKVRWDTGRAEGSFDLSLEASGVAFWLMTVSAAGHVEVQFMMLEAQKPFMDEAKRQELADRLEQTEGVRIPADELSGRPRIPLASLQDPDGLDKFLSAFDWAVRTIKRSWAARA